MTHKSVRETEICATCQARRWSVKYEGGRSGEASGGNNKWVSDNSGQYKGKQGDQDRTKGEEIAWLVNWGATPPGGGTSWIHSPPGGGSEG